MACFKKKPKGFLTFLAIVILTETALVYFCSTNKVYEYNNGIIDVIEDIDKGKFSKTNTCIIGGSVGAQAANELKVEHYDFVAALSSNIEIGMVGHYYTLKYYLAYGKRPRFCFLMLYPEAWSVELPNDFTTHAFFRPFGKAENVFDLLFTHKRLDLALKMLYFGAIPSSHYKEVFRYHLEEIFSNILSYFRAKNVNIEGQPEEKEEIDWKKKKEASRKRKFTPSKTSKIYFPKIVKLCKANNIKLFVIISALAQANISELEMRGYKKYLDELLESGLEFSYTKKATFVYPNEWFNFDGRHLSPSAKEKLSMYAQGLSKLMSELSGYQFKGNKPENTQIEHSF